MELVSIINGLSEDTTPQEARAVVDEYVKDKSHEEIFIELLTGKYRSEPNKSELSKKIRTFKLEATIFSAATGIYAQEQLSYRGNGNVKGHHDFLGLESLISGKVLGQKERISYFKDFSKRHLSVLTQEHKAYVNNFSEDYVRSTSKEQLLEELFANPFSLLKTSSHYSYFLDALSKKVRGDPQFVFELFKKLTGVTALEEITLKILWEKIGSRIQVVRIASFLSGERKTEAGAREFYQKLAKEHNMQKLTAEHQTYVNDMNEEYLNNVNKMQLRESLHFEKKLSIKNPTYVLFLDALSKKISADPALQLAFFKKWTGIEKPEQIRAYNHNGSQGYHSLVGLAHMLSGVEKTSTQAGKYFKELFVQHTVSE